MKLVLDNLALRKGKIMLNDIDTTTKIAEHYNILRDKVSDGKLHDKNEYLRLLVILRAVIRGVIHQNNRANDDLRYFKRHKRLLQNKGISLIPLEKHIEWLQSIEKLTQKTLVKFGKELGLLLDCWQAAGATREELFNLCNSHRVKSWKKEKLDIRSNELFREIVFIYNIDYPDDGLEWIDSATDAPFTHASIAYMLDIMLNTKEGKEASHRAMEEVFPDLMEKAMYVCKDEFGQRCLYNHEGELIGPIE